MGLPGQARVGQLANKLRQRLEPFVAGDTAGFMTAHTEEATRLAEAAFGEAMLHTIGCASHRHLFFTAAIGQIHTSRASLLPRRGQSPTSVSSDLPRQGNMQPP